MNSPLVDSLTRTWARVTVAFAVLASFLSLSFYPQGLYSVAFYAAGTFLLLKNSRWSILVMLVAGFTASGVMDTRAPHLMSEDRYVPIAIALIVIFLLPALFAIIDRRRSKAQVI